jgi:uncharacterized membrane protein YkoI
MTKTLRTLGVAAAMLLAGWLNTGAADAQGCLSRDEARAALQSGEVLSLAQIRGTLSQSVGGRIISADLCRSGNRYFYEVYVQVGGSVKRFRVDASTGAISGSLMLPTEGSDESAGRRG